MPSHSWHISELPGIAAGRRTPLASQEILIQWNDRGSGMRFTSRTVAHSGHCQRVQQTPIGRIGARSPARRHACTVHSEVIAQRQTKPRCHGSCSAGAHARNERRIVSLTYGVTLAGLTSTRLSASIPSARNNCGVASSGMPSSMTAAFA